MTCRNEVILLISENFLAELHNLTLFFGTEMTEKYIFFSKKAKFCMLDPPNLRKLAFHIFSHNRGHNIVHILRFVLKIHEPQVRGNRFNTREFVYPCGLPL